MTETSTQKRRTAAIYIPLSVMIMLALTFTHADLKSKAAGVVFVGLSLLLLTRFWRVFRPGFALLLGSVASWGSVVRGKWFVATLAALCALYGIWGLYGLARNRRSTEEA